MSAPALVLTAAGIGLGVAGALVSMRMISSLLFGVAPHDPVTFAVVSLGLRLQRRIQLQRTATGAMMCAAAAL
jgi:hypothetical protein